MAQYRRRPATAIISALQWLGPDEPGGASIADLEALGARIAHGPDWGQLGARDCFMLLLLPRAAWEQTLPLNVGYWLIRYDDGGFALQSDAGFTADYEPVDA